MYNSITSTWSAYKRPEAFVTKGKKRIKQFDGQVYLSDGDEYEIELFNPTQEVVLAKIKIDGDYIAGGGIVLRRGERVFLERFLESPDKFKFSTYEVNGNNTDVQDAIRNNGYVEIEFYSEYIPTMPNRTIYSGNTYTYSNSGTINGNPITFTTTGMGSISTSTAFYNASLTSNTLAGPNIRSLINEEPSGILRSRKMETGTTEMGSGSDQTFQYSNKTFNSYSFWTVNWKILPKSQKQYTIEEINVNYCGNCGTRKKKSTFKFCPHCGTKY